jgi:beta-lactamase regulating signal transducer with metallopeptidase domain
MNANALYAAPGVVVFCKWTLLLALGWVAQALLRERHSRWRVLVWRSIFCFTLLLPLWCFVPISTVTIPLADSPAADVSSSEPLALADSVRPAPGGQAIRAEQQISAGTISKRPVAKGFGVSLAPNSWQRFFLIGWGVGVVFGSVRLVRLHIQLARIRQRAERAGGELERQVREIQADLGISRAIEIRLSEAITSPFACGVFRPMILLPCSLSLSSNDLSVLLRHEIAHFRRHDLIWCVSWRWLSVVGWFHPLVWKVPAAHSLACEQEADRIASSASADRSDYAQVLARLTLRVLALPPVETRLTMNGAAQVTQRLKHLQRSVGAWTWKHTAIALALAVGFYLLVGGSQLSEKQSSGAKGPTSITFKQLLVVVQDESGKPVEGATIVPDGFRVKGPRRVDGHGWNTYLFGPPEKVTTDREGKALVKYPVEAVPDEKLFTGDVIFSVFHPDFCTTRLQSFPVDGSANPIRLTRGSHLEVSAWFGSDHQVVTDFVPNVTGDGLRPEDWKKKENRALEINRLQAGGHVVQLMARLPSGEVGYSDVQEFQADPEKKNTFAMEVKPGVRLEGRVDDSVPRPVKNGRVLISVRPPEFPAWVNPEDISVVIQQHGYPRFWHSYRTIAEDGSFVFESVPPGEVDVVVHGDGFISKNAGELTNRVQPDPQKPSKLVVSGGFGVPQPFPLVAPVTQIEVKTEPTATLQVTTKTKSGRAVEGAEVYVNPNVLRMQGIFGNFRDSSEAPYRSMPSLPNVLYSGKTDKDGKVILKNLPAFTQHLDVYHPDYELPLQEKNGLPHRSIRMEKLSPGESKTVNLTLQPKGKDFIGTAK